MSIQQLASFLPQLNFQTLVSDRQIDYGLCLSKDFGYRLDANFLYFRCCQEFVSVNHFVVGLPSVTLLA